MIKLPAFLFRDSTLRAIQLQIYVHTDTLWRIANLTIGLGDFQLNNWFCTLQILTVSPEFWSKQSACLLRYYWLCMLVIDNIRKGAGLANLKLRIGSLRRLSVLELVRCLTGYKQVCVTCSVITRELSHQSRLLISHSPSQVNFSHLAIVDFFESYFPNRLNPRLPVGSHRIIQRKQQIATIQ